MKELPNGATGFSFNLSNSMVRRLYITIRGAVQGVGFRPFVYRLAAEMKLTGWVLNSAQGVFIADVFLVHNRPIVRHVDDSIVRVMMDRELVLRRARGYAPLPITLCHSEESRHVLAVGAHLKNTVAMTSGNNIFISQHIGDLETKESFEAFKNLHGGKST